MKAARLIFGFAAIYGIAVLTPGLFIESSGAFAFLELSNPEYYYGFYGSVLVWQFAFLAIASDPVRYRPLMLIAAFEKAIFFAACLWLWQAGRLGAQSGPFLGAMVDGLLMLAFLAAWWITSKPAPSA